MIIGLLADRCGLKSADRTPLYCCCCWWWWWCVHGGETQHLMHCGLQSYFRSPASALRDLWP